MCTSLVSPPSQEWSALPLRRKKKSAPGRFISCSKQPASSATARRRKGSLDLRTHATLMKGGASGRVVVPHDPAKSRLYLLGHAPGRAADAAERSAKLSDDELEADPAVDRGRGVARGGRRRGARRRARAPTRWRRPRSGRSRRTSGSTGRSSAPVRRACAAAARRVGTRNPIDAFLRAAMKAKGLTARAAADRRTLIRRAYLDLLGLPPSPEEVDAFVNDQAPDAWPKLVDKLLASPHYGERWARHWLDLVRYADSGGFEFDVDRPEAWRYRDYVVKAFNDDKPYDAVHPRADRRRRVRARTRRGDDRDRLPAARAGRRRRRRARTAGLARRHRGDDDADVHGHDGRLRALPQPQVRSDSAEGLLPHPGGLLLDARRRVIRSCRRTTSTRTTRGDQRASTADQKPLQTGEDATSKRRT